MPMYWTFNCFLGCIYTVYCIVYIVVLVLNWLSNFEFWLPKKKDQVARIGVRGWGFRWFGQCPKENVFFYWCLPLFYLLWCFYLMFECQIYLKLLLQFIFKSQLIMSFINQALQNVQLIIILSFFHPVFSCICLSAFLSLRFS